MSWHPSIHITRSSLALLAILTLLPIGMPTTAAAEDADLLPPLADVPMFRMDSRRNPIQPGPGPQSKPELAWVQELDSDTTTDTILVGGLLIVGTSGGQLVALDARNGEIRWQAEGSGAFSGAPAAAAGIVVAADPATIRAFDATTGAERWHREVASVRPRIEITDGVVYVGTSDGAVRGLDLATGEDRWSWQGDPTLTVGVDLVADGVVYANPYDGRLLAIDTADGSERWRFLSRAPRVATMKVGDTVFVINPSDETQRVGQIAAVDAATGDVRWRFVPPSGILATAGPSRDGVLYVGADEDGMYALSDDGDQYTIVWHSDISAHAGPLVGDTFYGLTPEGSAVAVRASDGTLLWETEGGGWVFGPVVSGGMIFMADNGGGGTVRAYADPELIASLPDLTLATEPSDPVVADLPDPFRIVRATPLEDLGVTLSPFDPPRSQGPEGIDMTVGPDGLLYVIDPASVISVVDPETAAVVRRFGRQGAADGEFECTLPCTIDAAPDGRLYVVDRGNKRVQILDSEGAYLRQLGSFGESESQFVYPFRLAVDASGSVYVLDGANGLISKFDSDGAFLWRVDGPSGATRLAGGAYDLVVMKDGTILVTSNEAGQAVLLDPDDGSFVGPWGDESLGGSAEPKVDPAGNVFLFQYGPGAMRMFDREGRPLGILDYEDDVPDRHRFYPTPVIAPDGYGYTFGDTEGLLRLEIALP